MSTGGARPLRRADAGPGALVAGATREAAIAELSASLAERPPRIPSKYFYDAAGAELFERITRLPEYYPTRIELAIMERFAGEIGAALGPGVAVVEPGSGAGRKTQLLLGALERPYAYVPVDVADEQLATTARRLDDRFRDLLVAPVHADFTRPFALPGIVRPAERRAVYFPGSTIGNFTRDEARALLASFRRLVGAGGAAVVGADLRKDQATLELAYDDPQGVTAAFNLNALVHLNRELGTDFDLGAWRHRAPWVEEAGRIEMRLYALRDQVIRFAGARHVVRAGEYLLTEYSHKYRLEEFASLAHEAGWRTDRVWTDPDRQFSVHLLEA